MNSLSSITKVKNGQTRLITAENVYGEKGKGGMAYNTPVPQPEVEKIGQIWWEAMQLPVNSAMNGRCAPVSPLPRNP